MVTTIKRHRPGAEQKPSVAEVGATVTERDIAMQGGDSIRDDIRSIAGERTDAIINKISKTTKNLLETIDKHHKYVVEKPDTLLEEISETIKNVLATTERHHKFTVEKPDTLLGEISETTKNLLATTERHHKFTVEKPDTLLEEILKTNKNVLATTERHHRYAVEKPDTLLEEISETIKNVLEAIEKQHKDTVEKPDAILGEISETTKNLLATTERHHKDIVEKAPLMADYPRSGKKELPVGTTTIHIKEKKAELPDGTREDIYMARLIETCRSFTISTSRQIEVRASMDGALVYTGSLFAGSQQTHNLSEFDAVEIEADAVTAFHITLSEDAEGTPAVQPETTAEIHVGYNAAGDLVSLKKVADGVTYQRDVTDPDVADTTVDRWVVYGGWSVA